MRKTGKKGGYGGFSTKTKPNVAKGNFLRHSSAFKNARYIILNKVLKWLR